MQTDPKQSSILASRLKLVLIISIFLGPLFGAFIWYYGFDASQAPAGQSNYAPLIQPVAQIATFENRRYRQSPVNLDSLQKFWTMVHLVKPGCNDECRKSLYNTRQIHIAVGKDSKRVQRYLILQEPDLPDWLQTEHADASFLIDAEPGLGNQIRAIFRDNGLGADDAVLIDPLGNAMMAIPAQLEPRLFLKDLKKLLKISRIG